MWRVQAGIITLTQITPRIKLIKPARGVRQLNAQVSSRSLFGNVGRTEPRYMSGQPKRLCSENMTVKKIGTHNGTFHCDEVLACFFLRQLPEYKVGEMDANCVPLAATLLPICSCSV